MIALVDYGAGNLKSVLNAFETIGVKTKVVDKSSEIERASAIVLPGVGAFGDSMKTLKRLKLIEALDEQIFVKKKPYLGICLGLQFLATKSFEHGEHQGFGWVKGITRKIKPESRQFRIPHIGWNEVTVLRESPLFDGIESPVFYFVHSYHLELADSDKKYLVGTSWHGETITAAVQKDNIFGVQFHPEKSQGAGLAVLRNFIKLI